MKMSCSGLPCYRRIVLDRYGYQLEDNLVIETSKMYEQNDILIWVCLFVFAQISCSFNGDNSVMNGSDFNSTISGPSVIDFAWMFQLAAGIAQFWSGFAKCLIDIYWPFGRERRLNLIHWGGFMVCNRIGIGVMGGLLFDSSLASGSVTVAVSCLLWGLLRCGNSGLRRLRRFREDFILIGRCWLLWKPKANPGSEYTL